MHVGVQVGVAWKAKKAAVLIESIYVTLLLNQQTGVNPTGPKLLRLSPYRHNHQSDLSPTQRILFYFEQTNSNQTQLAIN